MNTQHLLDTELAAIVKQMPAGQFRLDDLPGTRAAAAQMAAAMQALLPACPGIEVAEQLIAAAAGSPAVRVLIYRPRGATGPLPALLWIHGGGYVLGQAKWDDFIVQPIAAELGCVLVSVDYRLAPETPHPGPLEDCYAALRWLHQNAEGLGVDAGRIAIAGLSAGGGLAAALGLLARDRRQVPIVFQALLQPMLDDRTAVTADPHPMAGEFVWTREFNHFGWSALLGGAAPGSEGVSPYAAAARADSLAGLPPTFIAVGALDLFVEENIEYARRLMRDGVPTELHVYPGACHAFHVLAPQSAIAQAHDKAFIAALKRALAAADPA